MPVLSVAMPIRPPRASISRTIWPFARPPIAGLQHIAPILVGSSVISATDRAKFGSRPRRFRAGVTAADDDDVVVIFHVQIHSGRWRSRNPSTARIALAAAPTRYRICLTFAGMLLLTRCTWNACHNRKAAMITNENANRDIHRDVAVRGTGGDVRSDGSGSGSLTISTSPGALQTSSAIRTALSLPRVKSAAKVDSFLLR